MIKIGAEVPPSPNILTPHRNIHLAFSGKLEAIKLGAYHES